MARTKASEAKRLGQLAHIMDNHLREENTKLHDKIGQLQAIILELKQKHEDEIIQNANYALGLIQRRERRIRELEGQWEDMANTLHDSVEENLRMIKRIDILEANLLDCTCNETV